jgi:hypothetical protein
LAGGVFCTGLAGAARCMPAGLPPPSRAASATVGTSAAAKPATSTAVNQGFTVIIASFGVTGHRLAAASRA